MCIHDLHYIKVVQSQYRLTQRDAHSRAHMTPVAPQNYPPDDTIVVKYLRGVLQT
jgi:hypothetical protein